MNDIQEKTLPPRIIEHSLPPDSKNVELKDKENMKEKSESSTNNQPTNNNNNQNETKMKSLPHTYDPVAHSSEQNIEQNKRINLNLNMLPNTRNPNIHHRYNLNNSPIIRQPPLPNMNPNINRGNISQNFQPLNNQNISRPRIPMRSEMQPMFMQNIGFSPLNPRLFRAMPPNMRNMNMPNFPNQMRFNAPMPNRNLPQMINKNIMINNNPMLLPIKNFQNNNNPQLKPKLNFIPKVIGEWTQYQTENGLNYYHNSRTKVTQWEKPKEIIGIEPSKLPSPWIECTTKNNDKTYYNTVTKETFKNMPLEHAQSETNSKLLLNQSKNDKQKNILPRNLVAQENIRNKNSKLPLLSVREAQKFLSKKNNSDNEQNWVKETIKESEIASNNAADATKISSNNEKSKQNEVEAEKHFIELLIEKKITRNSEWPEILNLIIYDNRYGAVGTLAKRKKIFRKFVEYLQKEYEKTRVEIKKKLVDDFWNCLTECKKIKGSSRYKEIIELVGKDPRFLAVERKTDREDLALNYVENLERKEKKKREKEFLTNVNDFEKLIREDQDISYKTKLKEMEKKICENKKYSDQECVKKLRLSEMSKICKRFIREKHREHELKKKEGEREKRILIEKEKKKQEKIKHEQKKLREKRDREQSSNFIELLKEITENRLHSKIKWEEVMAFPEFSKDPRYLCYLKSDSYDKNPKSGREKKAKALFEDYCCDIEDSIETSKIKLKKWLRKTKIKINHGDTVEKLMIRYYSYKENTENINENEPPEIKDKYLKLIFRELIAKAVMRKSEDKKKKKNLEEKSKKKKFSKKKSSNIKKSHLTNLNKKEMPERFRSTELKHQTKTLESISEKKKKKDQSIKRKSDFDNLPTQSDISEGEIVGTPQESDNLPKKKHKNRRKSDKIRGRDKNPIKRKKKHKKRKKKTNECSVSE